MPYVIWEMGIVSCNGPTHLERIPGFDLRLSLCQSKRLTPVIPLSSHDLKPTDSAIHERYATASDQDLAQCLAVSEVLD